jgi:hypothetical protein
VLADLEAGDVILRRLGVVQAASADTLVEGRARWSGRVAGEVPRSPQSWLGGPVPLGLAAASAGPAPATVSAAAKAVAMMVLR